MSREIKFRVWDKIMEDIAPLVELHSDWVAIPIMDEEGGHLEKRKIEDVELMQYTGFKDKNGKEIYEGDIVRSGKEYNYYTGLNSEIYGGRLYEIKNNGWRFYIEPHSLYDIDFKDLEVIGNIYENKEINI